MLEDRYNLPDPMGWLSRLNEKTRRLLLQSCDEILYLTDEAIYHADDDTGGLFCALTGRMDAHWPRLPAGRTLVHTVGPGWWIGDLSFVSGARRRVELTAGANSRILRLSRAQLFRIAETVPEIHFALLTMMASTLRVTTDIIESRSIDDDCQRVAACLLRLHYTGPTWNGELPITQKELASIAAMSRGRIIDAVKKLENMGLLKNKYGKICISKIDNMTKFYENNEYF